MRLDERDPLRPGDDRAHSHQKLFLAPRTPPLARPLVTCETPPALHEDHPLQFELTFRVDFSTPGYVEISGCPASLS